MPILNRLSGAFPTALIYITVGTLIGIWSIVSLVLNAPETQAGYFWVTGFLMTGLALLVIGLLLGRIGRVDRTAELALPELTTAAAPVPVVVPGNLAVQGTVPTTPVPGGSPRGRVPWHEVISARPPDVSNRSENGRSRHEKRTGGSFG